MGSLVNSVKPMAHTHSSIYQERIHTLKKKKQEKKEKKKRNKQKQRDKHWDTQITLSNLTKHM